MLKHLSYTNENGKTVAGTAAFLHVIFTVFDDVLTRTVTVDSKHIETFNRAVERFIARRSTR